MPQINFPTSPVLNQIYATGNGTWIWDGGAWRAYRPPTSKITISDGKFDAGSASSTANANLIANTTSTYTNLTVEEEQVITGKKTFATPSTTLSAIFDKVGERFTQNTTTGGASANTNFDVGSQSILYYTANAAQNWTINFRGSSSRSLNSLLLVNQSVTLTTLNTVGATTYYNTTIQVDGSGTGVTTRWLSGTATSGYANSINGYTYTIMKTANATFTVLASQSIFV